MWNWLISLEDCKASTSLVDALLADITKRIDEFLKIQKGDASAGPGKTDGRKLTRWEGDEFEKVVEVADFVRDKLMQPGPFYLPKVSAIASKYWPWATAGEDR